MNGNNLPVACPACGHVHGDMSCMAFVDRPGAVCGCTFSMNRLLRGEADALAGRVSSFSDTFDYLRGRYRNGAE